MRPSHGTLTPILLLLLIALTAHAGRPNNGARQFMGLQNAARTALGLRPFVWDRKLARYAKSYANRRRRDCALEHSGGPYGENIFWGSGRGWGPAQAAAAWVAERREYNYWANSCADGRECGHYTQIVWRDTKRIGCAKVVCDDDKGVFMTCNYDPPGNYIGERPY
ncbi:CAP (Cysteine-rich secretory proteins [Striga asiatica]|uniref:CAP (Cysteine-rich secretory proteins) n=1 Tax=Striga asiatica TaxID=4170 RepID=A0A5A7PE92_STRAF|nr:CAP (Cysteine-rich secretory proteins [Striga asiatica]